MKKEMAKVAVISFALLQGVTGVWAASETQGSLQKNKGDYVRDISTPEAEKKCHDLLALPGDDVEASHHTLDDHEWVRQHPDQVKKYNQDYEKLFQTSKKLKCLSSHWEKGFIYASDGSKAHIPWSWVR